MFTNEWPLELGELFTASNLSSEFSTVIIWQLSPRQADDYKCVITAVIQWPFLRRHFSLWITSKRFIPAIPARMWLVIQVVCFHSCSLTACLLPFTKGEVIKIQIASTFSLCPHTLCCQQNEFCFVGAVVRKHELKRKTREKKLFPEHSWVKKQQGPYLNTFSWKVNPKGHLQGHSECEIIQSWWTLTFLGYFVRREALYIHSLEFFPNWKPFPHRALNI